MNQLVYGEDFDTDTEPEIPGDDFDEDFGNTNDTNDIPEPTCEEKFYLVRSDSVGGDSEIAYIDGTDCPENMTYNGINGAQCQLSFASSEDFSDFWLEAN